MGRFVNRDPVGEQGGLNIYCFCGNAPVSRVDTLGLASFQMPSGWRAFCCDQLVALAQQITGILDQRYNAMLRDDWRLYNNPNARPLSQDPTGHGTWAGHQQQYTQVQGNLRQVVNEWINKGCGGSPPDPLDWETRAPPSMPTWASPPPQSPLNTSTPNTGNLNYIPTMPMSPGTALGLGAAATIGASAAEAAGPAVGEGLVWLWGLLAL